MARPARSSTARARARASRPPAARRLGGRGRERRVAASRAIRYNRARMKSALALVAVLALAAAAPARAGPAPSARPGLGAIPYGRGTTFRVWAPNADRVFVAGEWNGESETADELAREKGGLFSADVEGARAGQRYRFVLRRGAETLVRTDPRARRVVHSAAPGVIVDPAAYAWKTASPWKPAPLAEQVIYELHVGTFAGAAPGRPGTFAAAREKLDALADLGVDMIELMPPAEFPGDYSWGYNPAFPFAPESAYGAPDDLRALVDAAHARGIGVIVDVVHNHWGPQDLSLWAFDGETPGAPGGIYFFPDWRGKTPWGPRPDYSRAEVREYIRDNARMWLEEYRADGLRWDSVANIRQADGKPLPEGTELLRSVNAAVEKDYPWKVMIAEDLETKDLVTKPLAAGGLGFRAQWDAVFFHRVDDAICAAKDADRKLAAIAEAVTHAYNGHALERVIYTESHDEVANGRKRIPEMISPGAPASLAARKRSTLGAAIALTSPGIPMIFEGQELLEDGSFDDHRPLDWSKADTFAGIRALYKDLIALRRNRGGRTRGLTGAHVKVFHLDEKEKVIAYHRFAEGGPGDDVVVVANLGGEPLAGYEVGFPADGIWRVRLNSDLRKYAPDFGNVACRDLEAVRGRKDLLPYHGTVSVGAWSVLVLSQ
jgi:1,4-alpha-glucan branching enzyme